MADFQASASPSAHGRRPRSHRLSTRIDFTPMVDLGFLLITFFMLTTMLSKPTVMSLVMPDDSGERAPAKQSKVLTLLLDANDKVYWYEGLEMNQMDSTDFSQNGLRQVILQKMSKVAAKWGNEQYRDSQTGEMKTGSAINVIIKPSPKSRYKNLVDALDEMAICQVRYYCVQDISAEEGKKL